jgi:phosphomannomutase
MSEEGKSLSEIVEALRRSFESGEINFTVSNAKEIIETIKQDYTDGTLDDRDGIAISYPDWRLSVRTSNTEPLLRLNVEAYEKSLMEEKKNELVAKIKSLSK